MESLAFTVTWVSTDLKLLLLAMGGPLQLKYKFPGFFFLNGATSRLFPRNEKRTHSKMAGESHFWGEGRKSRKRLQKVVLWFESRQTF